MTPAKRLLLQTKWETLSHAYGSAADAPDHLLDLVSDDPAERRSALTYLWSAIVHQGGIDTATPFVARFLAALLPNEWLDLQTSSMYGDDIYPPTSTRAALLHFLGEVAETATYDKNADISPAVQEIAAELTESVFCWLGHGDPDTHAGAVYASLRLTRLYPQALPGFTSLLTAHVREGTDHACRASSVLGLGQLGMDTTSFLDDSSPQVRVFAALAESANDDERALAAIADALGTAPAADWVAARYHVVLGCAPQVALVRTLVSRATDFDNVAAAATAMATTATAPHFLTPLVELAFSAWDGLRPPLTRSRIRFLQALADNDALWIPDFIMPLQETLEERAFPTSQAALRNFLVEVAD